jgi:hypothetical protein
MSTSADGLCLVDQCASPVIVTGFIPPYVRLRRHDTHQGAVHVDETVDEAGVSYLCPRCGNVGRRSVPAGYVPPPGTPRLVP